MRSTQVAVLTDGSGWVFHPDMGLWLMLKPPAAGPAGAAAGSGGGLVRAVAAAGSSADADRVRAAAGAQPFMPALQQVGSVFGLAAACIRSLPANCCTVLYCTVLCCAVLLHGG
jgi:hypothetical protein